MKVIHKCNAVSAVLGCLLVQRRGPTLQPAPNAWSLVAQHISRTVVMAPAAPAHGLSALLRSSCAFAVHLQGFSLRLAGAATSHQGLGLPVAEA